MCIERKVSPGRVLDEEAIDNSWASNRDGGGIAWVDAHGDIKISKGHMNLVSMKKAYFEAAAENPDSYFLVHFRISTSGGIVAANTHPFMGKECAVIHNGVLFNPPMEAPRSDTRILIEDAAVGLTQANVRKKLERISNLIGSGNKMCFLFKDNTVAIANEDSGHWADGIWYSNSCYKSAFSFANRRVG